MESNMANNKLFGIKSAYILLLALMVSALCLPAAVSADLGEPVINSNVEIFGVHVGSIGTANVVISEIGGYDSAQNLHVTLYTDTTGVSFGATQTIPILNAGGSRTLSFPVYVDSSAKPQVSSYHGTITINYEETGAMGIGTYSHIVTSDFWYYIVGDSELKSQVNVPKVHSGDSGTATVIVSETGGQMPALNVKVTLSTDTQGVAFGENSAFHLANGKSNTLSIPLYTESSVKAGTYNGILTLDYDEYSSPEDIGKYHHSLTQHFQYTVEAPTQSKSVSGAGSSSYSDTESDNGLIILIIATIAFVCFILMCVAFSSRNKERREWERRNMGHPEWDRRQFR